MATDLLETDVARELLAAASGAGLDLATALQGDEHALRRTEIAQPALLLVECALASTVMQHASVVAVAGHSSGEYSACVAARALTALDAMRLVIERSRAMASMRDGAMCAVVGMDAEQVQAVCDAVQRVDGEVVVVANVNAPAQVVVSGSRRGVDRAVARALEGGARRAVPLNVSGAFHSPLMRSAAERFATVLDTVPLHDPEVPIVCNVDGAAVRDSPALRDRLRSQLTSPVQWVSCVQTLVALGATTLLELGPGSVLTGLARRIAPQVGARSVHSRAEALGIPASTAS